MPVKRRKVKEREHRITPEAVAAFRARDYLALHRALGLRPWETSPLAADDGEPEPWRHADDWRQAQALRRDLEAAG